MKALLTMILLVFSSSLFANTVKPENGGSEQTTMKIQGTRIPCQGTDGNTSCYQVQKGASVGTDFWEILPEPIAGFNFENGFTYLVTVKITTRENPAAGQSRFVYELVSVISKTAE